MDCFHGKHLLFTCFQLGSPGSKGRRPVHQKSWSAVRVMVGQLKSKLHSSVPYWENSCSLETPEWDGEPLGASSMQLSGWTSRCPWLVCTVRAMTQICELLSWISRTRQLRSSFSRNFSISFITAELNPLNSPNSAPVPCYPLSDCTSLHRIDFFPSVLN